MAPKRGRDAARGVRGSAGVGAGVERGYQSRLRCQCRRKLRLRGGGDVRVWAAERTGAEVDVDET